MQAGSLHIENLIIGYLQNELSKEQISEFKQLLSDNPEYRKLFSEISEVWALVNYSKFEQNKKSNFENNIKSRILPAQVSKKETFMWGNKLFKVAAVFLLIFTCTLIYMSWGTKRSIRIAQPIHTFVPKGDKTTVTLPDHTKVCLNSDSRLTYYTDFGKNVREIWLDGEACFNVAPDKKRPFLVNAGSLNIQVTGTTFNVRNYNNDENISVALVSGKVNISSDDHPENSVEPTLVSLKPNQLLTFNKNSKDISTREVNARDNIAWIKGIFKFHSLTFEQIAKELERKYNVTIYIRSDQLKKEKFTGSFSDKQMLDDIFNEIDMNHKYKWVKKKNTITITENK